MPVTLSHLTALRYLRRWSFLPHTPTGTPCPPEDLLARPNPDEIRRLLELADPLTLQVHGKEQPSLFCQPLDVVCAGMPLRSRSHLARSHLWSSPVPPGAVWPIRPGLSTSGPDFCLIQLAPSLSLPKLALLGCSLLASYAPSTSSPYGIVEAAPLVSLSYLLQGIERFAGSRGATQARACAAYVMDGSASPMESRVGLYLSLPKRLGGHGLPRPVLNQRYDVTGTLRTASDRSHYRTDLCWPEAHLALEYDSDAAHTGSDRIASDTRRRNDLAAMGITVLGVTRQQTRSAEELDRVASIVADRLGIAVRERRHDQAERRRKLFEELFRESRELV